MLYNERVTTDATPSVKIYEGNQGQAMMKEGAAVKQQAAREMQQAKELEEKSYKLSMMKGMNELWQNEQLSSNPQALASEMDKLSQKVTSNISDMDMRVNVLTDFELKKDSYINQATTKMKRIQEEKARSAAFDSIYANIDSLGMSFGNSVSGNYDEGDVVNFQYSLDRIKANINARNPDGTYVFSDAQRRAMAKDADEAIYKSFKVSFDNLSDKERESVEERLSNDSYSVGLSEGGSINMRDIVGADKYNDMKEYAKEYEERKVALEKKRIALEKGKQEIAQYNTEVALSDQLDDLDALDALKILDENQDVVSDKYYKAKRKALLSAKGIDAETQEETATEIAMDIASIPTDKPKDFIDGSSKVLEKIEEAYAEGKLRLSDKKNFVRNLNKRQVKALPDYIEKESSWFTSYDFDDAKYDFDKSFNDAGLSNRAMLEYIRTVTEKDCNTKQKKELVKTLINTYKNQELNKVTLKVGDIVKGYRYKGGDRNSPDSWEKI